MEQESSSQMQEDLAAAQKYIRIETRWFPEEREVEDLAKIARQISGHPTKRVEAMAYIIRLWSRVLHGELSPSAFWELFGVALPQAQSQPTPPLYPYPMMYPGMIPGMPGMLPGMPTTPAPPPEPPAEDAERKRKLVRNRQAVADEYV